MSVSSEHRRGAAARASNIAGVVRSHSAQEKRQSHLRRAKHPIAGDNIQAPHIN